LAVDCGGIFSGSPERREIEFAIGGPAKLDLGRIHKAKSPSFGDEFAAYKENERPWRPRQVRELDRKVEPRRRRQMVRIMKS
jgi:hypothetical protein